MKNVDALVESLDIDGLVVHVVGFSVTLEGDATATGAAADTLTVPSERAYFELLERIALVEHVALVQQVAPLQRRSISSGVALQSDVPLARRAAMLEVIERDSVLRSFFGGAKPQRLNDARTSVTLPGHYDVRAYRFAPALKREAASTEVVGVFAFPRTDVAPLSMGFAARGSTTEALRAAERELLQQIAFGWGEPIPERAPEPAATPEFHLDFYSYPGHHELLEAWLAGEHEGKGPAPCDADGEFTFVELTPAWMRGELRLVRAENPAAIPLVFGVGHPWFPDLPESMRVQPIA